MGRLPNSKRKLQNLNDFKARHRDADNKYRSNVQYLFSKLKEMLKNKGAKENVLNHSLMFINSVESEIIKKVGTNQMKIYRDEFLNFLLHEEALWKEKNVQLWWRKVGEALTAEEHFDENKRTQLLESDKSSDLKSVLKGGNLCCHTEIVTPEGPLQPFGESFLNRTNNPTPSIIENTSLFSEDIEFIPVASKVGKNILISYEEMPNSSKTFVGKG
ncbi:uncharacterized protein NPIL_392622 [Nephila pilipes]|uniref:Uncharacterized protein n=1 Tax=Nephila pilipes TaxID=299642 RepID=A0A8X6QDT1_NEPPI|nr:uncharacterized protein NPIL_392622 [Nephila pilipes]